MFKKLLTSIVFLSGLNLALGQADFSIDHVPGQYLVKLAPGASMDELLAQYQLFQGKNASLVAIKLISPPFRIWQLGFDPAIDERGFMAEINKNPAVQTIQLNYQHEWRGEASTIPNDPLFAQQWQYVNDGLTGGVADADIDADEAWDITTGGVTPLGDTIVVCVVDNGCNLNHPDLRPNLWVNRAEIAGNGIDDDGNGYVDDYRGWNGASDDDDVDQGQFASGHGTAVAGIVGAKGNNGIGVSGVNWDVKVMVVVNQNATTAAAIEAYTYPLVMRRRYNQTNGQQGAFVVATNSSWGVNYGQPANEPLWCAFYDSLGQEGILSMGAGPNLNLNVDVQGDLPTGCTSDFLISVTNMNKSDIKVTSAGYGINSIDLGSFGEQTYTTSYNNYAGFGGTSGATPHVSGTVALMYSVPCPGFMLLVRQDPAQAALLMKQYLLNAVDPNASLAGITVTGGRLNTRKALLELLANCPADTGCIPPFSLMANNITADSADLSWASLDTPATYLLHYRELGGIWDTIYTNTPAYTLGGLDTCTTYEAQVAILCDTAYSEFIGTLVFKTQGCCIPPGGISISNIDNTSAAVQWTEVLGAQSYIIEYSEEGTGIWMSGNATAPPFALNNLSSCKVYQVVLKSVCSNGQPTVASDTISFRTTDCGACLDLTYCPQVGNTNAEWIQSIRLGAFSNFSGDNDGYLLYSGGAVPMARGETIGIDLTPGYAGQAYSEVFKIWMDINQDGDFADLDEVVFLSAAAQGPVLNATLTVPASAQLGITRMRVAMRWQNPANTCSNVDYGEVEDYCILIDSLVGVNEPFQSNFSAQLSPNPFGDMPYLNISQNHPTPIYISTYNITGQLLWSQQFSVGQSRLPLSGMENLPTGMYFVKVQTEDGEVVLKAVKY